MSRSSVLFVAESVSLAHVARPVRLADSLDDSWDIHFACAQQYRNCFDGHDWPIHSIESVPPAEFLKRLQRGAPLCAADELERSVHADLGLIERLKPDVVVGDFRLSLAVSARLAKVPYVAICNAHWSPWAEIRQFPAPDISILRLFPTAAANLLFRIGRPVAFRLHALPINRIRQKFGLAPYADIRWAYTDGDLSLYADSPLLVPTHDLPSSHRYLGPILWAPKGNFPEWWNRVATSQPLAYVTLGSTGRADLLPMALKACEDAKLTTVVATAGRTDVPSHDRRFVANFLPGDRAAQMADLVVCNGGSATVYQALSKGVPVVGVCSNLDQFLTMQCVERVGAGVGLGARSATLKSITTAITEARKDLHESAAKRVQQDFATYELAEKFPGHLRAAIREYVIGS